MLRFTQDLPESIVYKGKEYKLSLAYDNVIRAYEILEDDSLLEHEKLDLILYFLVSDRYPLDTQFLYEIAKLISPATREDGSPKLLDFQQDADYIYAAFLQAYGIDLIEARGKLHWFKFLALLNGLPENTKFAQIVGIRQRPLPAPTKHNGRERAELASLKAAFALKTSDAEKEKNYQQGLARLAQCLLRMAEKR